MRRVIAALIAFVWGVPLLLFGVLALIYSADSRSETAVDLAGHRIDADLAGALALVGAAAALLCFVAMRRHGGPARGFVGRSVWLPALTPRLPATAAHATVDRLAAFVLWTPALIGVAYLLVFVVRLPTLIARVYWDSDAATATVVAQTFGHGTVILERFGWFTGLWFELLTRPLPFHRQIWETGPYAFALVSVGLLAWASWRLAGVWAAAMTATAAVATSPFVSYDLVTVNYHTATWAATVVLAVFCLWAAEKRRTIPEMALRLSLVTLLAGATLASDWLFAFVGLLPFVLTGLLLATLARTRIAGAALIVAAGAAVLVAWATRAGMQAAHVRVFAVPTRFADATDLWPNVGRLLRGVVQLANGDYFFGSQLTVRSALSLVCATLILLALVAMLLFWTRKVRARVTASEPLLAYSTFWILAVAFSAASFVFSSEGTHGGYYLVPILYATAAIVPLALGQTQATRLIAAAGIAAVAALSLINLSDPNTEFVKPLPPVASVANRVVATALKEHALRGYADYWDASSLTWSKHMAVDVSPVSQCDISHGKTDLCGYWFNVNTRWYQPKTGNTFVLIDRQSDGLRQNLPPTYGRPLASYQLNSNIIMAIYPYDVAHRFTYVPTP
ncbi:MAG: hypothetical protein ACJ74M_03595 [Gaiellaceae bacterium]